MNTIPSYEVLVPTTFIQAHNLSSVSGCAVTLILETFQRTGSFKFRAAFHLAFQRPERRLIAASSGNFGQALALACQMLGKTAHIVMPVISAQVKIDAVRSYGGLVELVDVSVQTRAERVEEISRQFPDAYIASAFDDPLVIEGNSTLAKEIVGRGPPLDLVLVPVGGGGLSAGIIQGLSSLGSEAIQVFGAEPAIANDAAQSLRKGALVAHPLEPQTIADGARTLSLGKRNFEILRKGLVDILEVPEQGIRQAVKDLFLRENVKAEPTGALSVAALRESLERFRGLRVGCVISGGNCDWSTFAEILGG